MKILNFGDGRKTSIFNRALIGFIGLNKILIIHLAISTKRFEKTLFIRYYMI